MTVEAKDTVIAELKETFEEEEGKIETMCDILAGRLVSDESLLLCALGSAHMVDLTHPCSLAPTLTRRRARSFTPQNFGQHAAPHREDENHEPRHAIHA